MLKKAIAEVKDIYDFTIIDCAPSLGLITLNALTAVILIIPIQCEYFALEGLGKLLNTIKSVQKLHNNSLEIEGLLLTMYDSRLRLSNQVVSEVKKHFQMMVFKTVIPRNVKLGEAPSHGKNIVDYDATSKGAKNYIKLAQELINKSLVNGKAYKKQPLGRGLSALLSDQIEDIESANDKNADQIIGNIIEIPKIKLKLIISAQNKF